MRPADPNRVQKAVGRRIAELRRGRGLTQEQLADAVDTSLKYLQRIEAGSENLTIQSLVKLANALRAPLAALFEKPASVRRRRPGRPASQ
jgi:transcriptional regulator with XRE-family HTH domain